MRVEKLNELFVITYVLHDCFRSGVKDIHSSFILRYPFHAR